MLTTRSSLLIRLRSSDDSQAWSQFARLYTPLIHYWVSQLGVDREQVQDLVQDVFIVLLKQADQLADNPPQKFRAWLRTVTLNKTRDWLRTQNRLPPTAVLENLEIAQQDPQVLLTETEYRIFLTHTALKMMREWFSETTWRAVWEHVACKRPAANVAKELGISENAVYLARGRVLKRLREELDGLWE